MLLKYKRKKSTLRLLHINREILGLFKSRTFCQQFVITLNQNLINASPKLFSNPDGICTFYLPRLESRVLSWKFIFFFLFLFCRVALCNGKTISPLHENTNGIRTKDYFFFLNNIVVIEVCFWCYIKFYCVLNDRNAVTESAWISYTRCNEMLHTQNQCCEEGFWVLLNNYYFFSRYHIAFASKDFVTILSVIFMPCHLLVMPSWWPFDCNLKPFASDALILHSCTIVV